MKKIFIVIGLFVSTICTAQQFTCQELDDFVAQWNTISQTYKGTTNSNWALAIMKEHLYNLNDAAQLEYSYVIHSTDTFDINALKEITYDFISANFKLNQTTRSALIQGSTENSVYFKAHIPNYVIHEEPFLATSYSADIIFQFKYKDNRLKMIITIPNFIYNIGNQYINRYSFQQVINLIANSKKEKNKDVHCRALIETIARMTNYAYYYKGYLNKHYSSKGSSEEDW